MLQKTAPDGTVMERFLTVRPLEQRPANPRSASVGRFRALEQSFFRQQVEKTARARKRAVHDVLASGGVPKRQQVLEAPLSRSEVRALRSLEAGSSSTIRGGSRNVRDVVQRGDSVTASEMLRQDRMLRDAMKADSSIRQLIVTTPEEMWTTPLGVAAMREALADPITADDARSVLATSSSLALVYGSRKLADSIAGRTFGVGDAVAAVKDQTTRMVVVNAAHMALGGPLSDSLVRLHSVLDPRDAYLPADVPAIAAAQQLVGTERSTTPAPLNGQIDSTQRAAVLDAVVDAAGQLVLTDGSDAEAQAAREAIRLQYGGLSDADLCGVAYNLHDRLTDIVESVHEVQTVTARANIVQRLSAPRPDGSDPFCTADEAFKLMESPLLAQIEQHVQVDGGRRYEQMLQAALRETQNFSPAAAASMATALGLPHWSNLRPLWDNHRNLLMMQVEMLDAVRARADVRSMGSEGSSISAADLARTVNAAALGAATGPAAVRSGRVAAIEQQAKGAQPSKATEQFSAMAGVAVGLRHDPEVLPLVGAMSELARDAATDRTWASGRGVERDARLHRMLTDGWKVVGS